MRAYLDYASTAPPRPGVVDAMVEWMGRTADPGRVHTEGRMVRAAIEDARESVAGLLGVRPREVVFTSGATEAANAAVFGATTARPGVVVSSPLEHSCVRTAAARSATVVDLGVDGAGRLRAEELDSVLDQPVALVTCQWGNHEVGTLQPVAEVVERCHRAGTLVHLDAAAAVGQLPLDLGAMGADLVSVSGHKFGGPAGSGALVVRRGLRLPPFVVGGEQERARRAGLENVAAIVGMGVAASAAPDPDTSRRHTAALLDAALAVPGVVTYGDTVERLPHIVCIGVEGVEAEAVLLGLDQAGVAAHSGSACSSESLEPSPVLEAMGVDAQRSLRLSVGWSTTADDIDTFARAFPAVVARLRALGGG